LLNYFDDNDRQLELNSHVVIMLRLAYAD